MAVATATAAIPQYYLSHELRLKTLPRNNWAAAGMEIIVILADPQVMYYKLVEQAVFNAQVARIVKSITKGTKIWLAVWANNNYGLTAPNQSTFFWWNSDEYWNNIFRPNLARLAEAARNYKIDRICWDSEIYLGTKGNNGGPMNKDYAWIMPPDPNTLKARAEEVYRATQGMQVGTYVWTRDATAFNAFNLFHNTLFQKYKRTPLIFDEGGYVMNGYNAKREKRNVNNKLPHCFYIQGETLDEDNANLAYIKNNYKSSRFFYDWNTDVW